MANAVTAFAIDLLLQQVFSIDTYIYIYMIERGGPNLIVNYKRDRTD